MQHLPLGFDKRAKGEPGTPGSIVGSLAVLSNGFYARPPHLASSFIGENGIGGNSTADRADTSFFLRLVMGKEIEGPGGLFASVMSPLIFPMNYAFDIKYMFRAL